MENVVEVNATLHKNILIDARQAEKEGEKLNLLPVVVSEFNNLVVQYPIVLTKKADTGAFTFSALLGLAQNENLFWQHDQWQGIYLPLHLQRQPFFIGRCDTTDENNQYRVCINTDSAAVHEDEIRTKHNQAQFLFTESGEENQLFIQAKQSLARLLQGEMDNAQLITILNELDLLQPLSLDITFIDKQKTRLAGLYTIDQEKLSQLPSEHITRLHQQQYLQPIYTLIASLGHIYSLIALKNTQLSG